MSSSFSKPSISMVNSSILHYLKATSQTSAFNALSNVLSVESRIDAGGGSKLSTVEMLGGHSDSVDGSAEAVMWGLSKSTGASLGSTLATFWARVKFLWEEKQGFESADCNDIISLLTVVYVHVVLDLLQLKEGEEAESVRRCFYDQVFDWYPFVSELNCLCNMDELAVAGANPGASKRTSFDYKMRYMKQIKSKLSELGKARSLCEKQLREAGHSNHSNRVEYERNLEQKLGQVDKEKERLNKELETVMVEVSEQRAEPVWPYIHNSSCVVACPNTIANH